MMPDRIKGPCTKDCPDRTRNGEKPNCHDVCEKYLTYRYEIESYKAREIEGRKQGSDASSFLVKNIRKNKYR